MAYGFVYVLENESMPDIYKIGHSLISPMERASQLSSSTGVPKRFQVVMYGEMSNPGQIERDLHHFFRHARINKNREFFRFANFDLLNVQEELIARSEHFVSSESLDLIDFFYSREFEDGTN